MNGLTKRQQASMDRELTRALTTACDHALTEIVGFEWLTHRVDYQRFPQSLLVTWVFTTEPQRQAAKLPRLHALTLAALDEAGIAVSDIAAHVRLDSEERCTAQDSGDWATRLSARGQHG